MKKSILVVDDEENIRRMMRLTLEAANFDVTEARDGDEALTIFGDGSTWSAVLLDQRMPGMDGLEVLSKLKRVSQRVPVVMITAYASIELAVDAMKLGATDFVRKPMTPEILRGAVNAALAREQGGAAVISTPWPWEESLDVPVLTLNGFEIRRSAGKEGSSRPDSHQFILTSPTGLEKEITVEISSALVSYVERMTRRELPPDNSFWATQAERFIGNYLWTEGKLPPGNRLTLTDIDQADLAVAARWKG